MCNTSTRKRCHTWTLLQNHQVIFHAIFIQQKWITKSSSSTVVKSFRGRGGASAHCLTPDMWSPSPPTVSPQLHLRIATSATIYKDVGPMPDTNPHQKATSRQTKTLFLKTPPPIKWPTYKAFSRYPKVLYIPPKGYCPGYIWHPGRFPCVLSVSDIRSPQLLLLLPAWWGRPCYSTTLPPTLTLPPWRLLHHTPSTCMLTV